MLRLLKITAVVIFLLPACIIANASQPSESEMNDKLGHLLTLSENAAINISPEKKVFVNKLVKEQIKPEIADMDNEELDYLFVRANAKHLTNNLAYFIAKKIFTTYKETNDIIIALCQNNFTLTTLMAENKHNYILKHLKLLQLGKEEQTVADYIALHGEKGLKEVREIKTFLSTEENSLRHILNLEKKNLTSLKGLDLITNPEEITELHLGYNSILDPDVDPDMPKKPFTRYTKAKKLMLDVNQLTNLNADFLQGLDNLEDFSICKNKLQSLPENFFDNTKTLQYIAVSWNKIKSLPTLHNLTNLKTLSAEFNKISALPDGTFKNLGNLALLRLSNNYISNISSNALMPLTSIERIYLYDNQLTKIPNIKGLYKLNHFDISHNKLEKIVPNTFDGLRLHRLNISHNNISGLTKEHLGSSNIRCIDLDDNNTVYLNNKIPGNKPTLFHESIISTLQTKNIHPSINKKWTRILPTYFTSILNVLKWVVKR